MREVSIIDLLHDSVCIVVLISNSHLVPASQEQYRTIPITLSDVDIEGRVYIGKYLPFGSNQTK